MTSTRSPFDAARTALTAGAAARRCSKLSSRIRSSLPRRKPSRSSRAPIACATSDDTSCVSERLASGTQKTPSRSVPMSSAATWSARRVFPVPPGPVIVRSRVPLGEQCDELAELVLSTDERARRDRQVGGVERPQRREVAVAQLMETLGSGEVLQPVLSEITSCGVAVQEPSCRLGEDDLSPVSSGGDPRRAVNVDADVAFVRHDRLAGVDSHADPDGAGLELAPRLGSGGNGVGGAGKRDEEGIALRVHLDTGMSGERVPQGSAVLGKQVGVARPVLLKESRRALDVREEKGDGSSRKLARIHRAIMSPRLGGQPLGPGARSTRGARSRPWCRGPGGTAPRPRRRCSPHAGGCSAGPGPRRPPPPRTRSRRPRR